MDLGRAFGYVFNDQSWIAKVLIGGIILIVPILNFAAYGYMVDTTRNLLRGETAPLPNWGDDFGGKFVRGFQLFVIGLVYALPVILLWCISFAFNGMSSLSNMSNEAAFSAAAFGVSGLFSCLIFLYAIAILFISPAIYLRFVTTDDMGAALRFGEVIRTATTNVNAYLIALLVSLLASVVGSLGMIACGIGTTFTAFYSLLVLANAYAQLPAQPAETPATI